MRGPNGNPLSCQENCLTRPVPADPDSCRMAGGRSDASGADALPCLYSHNSIDAPENTPPKLTGHAARRAFAVKENAARFINSTGLDRVGFLTLTFPEPMLDHREASRRWDSLNTNLLPLLFGHWQRVFERTKKGNVHYHVLVDCQRDIRTGFNFDLYLSALLFKKIRLLIGTLKGRPSVAQTLICATSGMNYVSACRSMVSVVTSFCPLGRI